MIMSRIRIETLGITVDEFEEQVLLILIFSQFLYDFPHLGTFIVICVLRPCATGPVNILENIAVNLSESKLIGRHDEV